MIPMSVGEMLQVYLKTLELEQLKERGALLEYEYHVDRNEQGEIVMNIKFSLPKLPEFVQLGPIVV